LQRIVERAQQSTGVAEPRWLYIGTATGDKPIFVNVALDAIRGWGFVGNSLPLFDSFDLTDLDAFVASHQIIFVAGGNTVSMLAVWRRHGVDRAIHAAANNGTILTGESAGGLCWWDGGSSDSFGNPVQAIHDGLGWVPGAFAPHYDSEADRRPLLHKWVAEGVYDSAYGVDDDVALHVVDGKVIGAFSERAEANAYLVARDADGNAVEKIITSQRLS
jgi:peptidase E